MHLILGNFNLSPGWDCRAACTSVKQAAKTAIQRATLTQSIRSGKHQKRPTNMFAMNLRIRCEIKLVCLLLSRLTHSARLRVAVRVLTRMKKTEHFRISSLWNLNLNKKKNFFWVTFCYWHGICEWVWIDFHVYFIQKFVHDCYCICVGMTKRILTVGLHFRTCYVCVDTCLLSFIHFPIAHLPHAYSCFYTIDIWICAYFESHVQLFLSDKNFSDRIEFIYICRLFSLSFYSRLCYYYHCFRMTTCSFRIHTNTEFALNKNDIMLEYVNVCIYEGESGNKEQQQCQNVMAHKRTKQWVDQKLLSLSL